MGQSVRPLGHDRNLVLCTSGNPLGNLELIMKRIIYWTAYGLGLMTRVLWDYRYVYAAIAIIVLLIPVFQS